MLSEAKNEENSVPNEEEKLEDSKNTKFKFLDPGILQFKEFPEISLRLIAAVPADPQKVLVPWYNFGIVLNSTSKRIGRLSLRIGDAQRNLKLFYGGNIGYNVDEKYRGNRFAAKAVTLVLPFAFKNKINPVVITCGVENIASKRTCEIVGGKFLGEVDVPPERMWSKEKRVCRFLFDKSSKYQKKKKK